MSCEAHKTQLLDYFEWFQSVFTVAMQLLGSSGRIVWSKSKNKTWVPPFYCLPDKNPWKTKKSHSAALLKKSLGTWHLTYVSFLSRTAGDPLPLDKQEPQSLYRPCLTEGSSRRCWWCLQKPAPVDV